MPETLLFGGTTSTVYALLEVFLSSKTTSLNSSSGKQGSSIFDLSETIGHFTTLHWNGSLTSRTQALPVINLTCKFDSSKTEV